MTEFGGHEGACGLTIIGENNYNKFKEKISAVASKALKDVELTERIEIETEIKLFGANWELVDELDKFAPFGVGNPEPLFLTRNLKVQEVATMGKNNQHLRLLLEDEKDHIFHKFVGFGLAEKWGEILKDGTLVDVVYEFGVNEWNGNRELQFKIVDLRLVN